MGWRGREREVQVEKSEGVIDRCACSCDTTFDLCVRGVGGLRKHICVSGQIILLAIDSGPHFMFPPEDRNSVFSINYGVDK